MKKDKFFSFRTNKEDRQYIGELSKLLVRNKADAVRFAIKKLVFSMRFPKEDLQLNKNEPAS